MRRRCLALVGLASTLVAGANADAQSILRMPAQHANQLEVEVHAAFGFNYYNAGNNAVGLGAGVRVGIVLLPNGPLPSINNSLAVSVGGDFLYNTYSCGRGTSCAYLTLVPELMAQWNFYFTPILSAFVEIGVAPEISFGRSGNPFVFYPGAAIGGRVHFKGETRLPSLTVRVGFPIGLTIGVSF